ncbi:transketolase [Rhodococcus wratislaviensis IFP 2016]|nr:transketolase [Rhodococcus wratislaviensis IFP 2016]
MAAVKAKLGFDSELTFQVEPEVIAHTRNAHERGAAARA